METCGQDNPEKVKQMETIWEKYLAEHTAAEVETTFQGLRIPVSMVYNAEDAFNHPHWQARGSIIKEQDATTGEDFYDICTSPRFIGTPCDTHRGGPLLGQQSDQIMQEVLGYSEQKIEELKACESVAASLTTK